MFSFRMKEALLLFRILALFLFFWPKLGESLISSQKNKKTRALASPYVDVVLTLKAASVAEVHASRGGKKTKKAERDVIVKGIKSDQEFVKASVLQAGGQILNQFQHALNGIKVRIPKDKVNDLAVVTNVTDVLPVGHYEPVSLEVSVPAIGASSVWNNITGLNFHGEGIKVGIIDTGIDYTHANFGGPGTTEAYESASAHGNGTVNPSWFGPNAPKIKGGFDFVGNQLSNPVADVNPLDCAGHGSHVAGILGGFGVTSSGETYAGPYDSSIYDDQSFLIGPGVAPKADLYAYKVFDCGNVFEYDVLVDAIDRAIMDDMDVINLSLGSDFDPLKKSAEDLALENAVKSGVISIVAAGNAGPIPYVVGNPSTGVGSISVASSNVYPAAFPGADLMFADGQTITVQNSNGATLVQGATYTVIMVLDDPTTEEIDESIGCTLESFPTKLPADALAVVRRGVCARVDKAKFGQMAGAAAVAMINSDDTYPPYEDSIPNVTIPFFGVKKSQSDKLSETTGSTVTLMNIGTKIPNQDWGKISSFSSMGPRFGDSHLKPEITAPGSVICSTAVGTGNGKLCWDGTSMAAPHVAGVAALVRQAHPTWDVAQINAAIISTANPDLITDYSTRNAGAGLVQAVAAVTTDVIVSSGQKGEVPLNFGFLELAEDLQRVASIEITNTGPTKVTLLVNITNQNGVSHTLIPKTNKITIHPNKKVTLSFELRVLVSSVLAADSSDFLDVAGIIKLTPLNGSNHGVVLNLPYYMVTKVVAKMDAKISKVTTNNVPGENVLVQVSSNGKGAIPGDAHLFTLGLQATKNCNYVRHIGVKSLPDVGGVGDPAIYFGINTCDRISNPSGYIFLISIDVDPQNNNGDDYQVYGLDYGNTNPPYYPVGWFVAYVYSTRSLYESFVNPYYYEPTFQTIAPLDSSSVILSVLASQLCAKGEPCLDGSVNTRFTYHIDMWWPEAVLSMGTATYNPFHPTISILDADLMSIDVGGSANTTVQLDYDEFAQSPALGLMVMMDANEASDEVKTFPWSDIASNKKKTKKAKQSKGKKM